MKRKFSLLLAIALLSKASNATELPREQWMGYMEAALPTYQCQNQTYFRQCFNITQEKCEDVMASATRTCLSKFEESIPATLVQPKDGTFWGSKVGACAGTAYDATLKEEHTNTARCKNPNLWR